MKKSKVKKIKKSSTLKKKKQKAALAGGKRDVLFSPWRLPYVRKSVKQEPEACVFCGALSKGVTLDSLIVFQNEHASVIMNRFPYNVGHLMVIPQKHTAQLDMLDEMEYSQLYVLIKRATAVLRDVYQPQGFNIGLNLGRAGGAGIVDHLHFHIVPRWVGDTNFMPVLGGTKVLSETLDETFQRIRSHFQEIV